ncbi:hypothetical protein MMC30_001029 [Trapelia coarctata]|nr:hypothetical protein [Trapelia coarctata]
MSSNPAPSVDDGDLSFSKPPSDHPELLVYHPKGPHTHTFIILHGRGDNAQSFGPGFMLSEHSSGKSIQDLLPGMKFIFPTAKRRRMAAQNRCTIHQWFDIVSLKDTSKQEDVQVEGLRESTAFIHQIIKDELHHIPCNSIILGGLSQGCATALYSLLTFEPAQTEIPQTRTAIGAVVGMSGWLPFCKQILDIIAQEEDTGGEDDPFDRCEQVSAGSKEVQALGFVRENIDMPPLTTLEPLAPKTPVFLGHGTADDTVDVSLGKEAASALRGLGNDVTWAAYRGFYHWYKEPDEIDDIITFLQEKMQLGSTSDDGSLAEFTEHFKLLNPMIGNIDRASHCLQAGQISQCLHQSAPAPSTVQALQEVEDHVEAEIEDASAEPAAANAGAPVPITHLEREYLSVVEGELAAAHGLAVEELRVQFLASR